MSTAFTDTTAPAEVQGLWEQGEVDNNPWEGYDKLHPWRSDDDSSDSWHSGQTMGSHEDHAPNQDNYSDSWHTCPTMGSNKSQSDPQDPPHTTDYDTDNKDYEQRTRVYITMSWDVPS